MLTVDLALTPQHNNRYFYHYQRLSYTYPNFSLAYLLLMCIEHYYFYLVPSRPSHKPFPIPLIHPHHNVLLFLKMYLHSIFSSHTYKT